MSASIRRTRVLTLVAYLFAAVSCSAQHDPCVLDVRPGAFSFEMIPLTPGDLGGVMARLEMSPDGTFTGHRRSENELCTGTMTAAEMQQLGDMLRASDLVCNAIVPREGCVDFSPSANVRIKAFGEGDVTSCHAARLDFCTASADRTDLFAAFAHGVMARANDEGRCVPHVWHYEETPTWNCGASIECAPLLMCE